MNHTKRANHANTTLDSYALPQPPLSEALNAIFARLKPQDIEQFYKSYQLWSLKQQIAGVHQQISALQQHIAANEASLQAVQPSAIALSTLAQLQACGVTDVDLLDSMLTRGEDWLDYTMQLLERCESLDIIHGNYTEWCEHALEGAYDWIASMAEAEAEEAEVTPAPTAASDTASTPLAEATEELLLQKLMSEEETIKLPRIPRTPKITQPLAEALPSSKITQPLAEIHASRRITRPLAEELPQTPTASEPPILAADTPTPPSLSVEALAEAPTDTILPSSQDDTQPAASSPEEMIVSTPAEIFAEDTIASTEAETTVEEIPAEEASVIATEAETTSGEASTEEAAEVETVVEEASATASDAETVVEEPALLTETALTAEEAVLAPETTTIPDELPASDPADSAPITEQAPEQEQTPEPATEAVPEYLEEPVLSEEGAPISAVSSIPEEVVLPDEETHSVEGTPIAADAAEITDTSENTAISDAPITAIPAASEAAPVLDNAATTEEMPPLHLDEPASAAPDNEPVQAEIQDSEATARPALETETGNEPVQAEIQDSEATAQPALEQPLEQPPERPQSTVAMATENEITTETAQPMPEQLEEKSAGAEADDPPLPPTEEIIVHQPEPPPTVSAPQQQAVVPARRGFLSFLRRLLSWLWHR